MNAYVKAVIKQGVKVVINGVVYYERTVKNQYTGLPVIQRVRAEHHDSPIEGLKFLGLA